jgi:hypothetical protein
MMRREGEFLLLVLDLFPDVSLRRRFVEGRCKSQRKWKCIHFILSSTEETK